MNRQWIVGAALLALVPAYTQAEVAQPSEKVLKQKFSEQYHGILKLDAITLKNLDAMGNQATWSAEGDVSSSDDLYTGVGMAADYYFIEKTWTKDRPVKFSVMLTSTGTPDSGWAIHYYSMQAAASNEGRAMDDIKTNDKYLVVNGDDFNYRFSQIDASYRTQKASIEKLEVQASSLEKQVEAAQKERQLYWGKDSDGKPLTMEDVYKRLDKERTDYEKANDSNVFANKYENEVYQPAITACQKQIAAGQQCDEAAIRQKKDIVLSTQQRDVFLKSQALRRKAQDEMIKLRDGLTPFNYKVFGFQKQLTDVRMQIDDINTWYERWKKDTDDLRRKGIIK